MTLALGELKQKGVLTAAEFRAEKKRLLEDRAAEEEVPAKPSRSRGC